MQGDRREFELSFELAEDALQQVRSKRLLREIGVGRPVTRMFRYTHFDTPDSALRAAGLSLGIRVHQKAWLQSVKEDRGVLAGTIDRLEFENRIQGQAPNLDTIKPKRLRKRIKKAVAGMALEPVFEKVVWRTTRRLRASDGGEVELALYRGEIRGSKPSKKICAAELGLKSASPQSVFILARDLFADEPLQLWQTSNAEREYLRCKRLHVTPLEPKPARAPRLKPKQTTEQAFRRILESCVDQVVHNVHVVLESEDPEGPHQLRIGLRRLRCALGAYKPFGHQATLRRLNAEARDLGRAIGELRDVDVMIDEFVSPYGERSPSEAGIKTLLKELHSHRDRVRQKVRRHLASTRVRAFQLDLCAAVEGDLLRRPCSGPDAAAIEAPVGDFASTALQTFWRKPSKLGKRLDQLSIAERHELRKALKNFRYIAEFFAPLYPPKAVRRYLRHLKQLQNVFGYLNDVEMTKKLREVCSEGGSADANLHWTVGHIQGFNEARAELAWENARSRWRKLKKAKAFWS